jgi:subtilisin-like proprotein convertase family protein
MTPVKDQASCGGCWAFSAVGTTEAVYNIDAGNPNLDLDLSEEYLVSDCYTDWDQSCCGGWQSEALKFIRDDGIPDEACLPWASGTCYCDGSGCYSAYCAYSTGGSCANATCSDKCENSESRLQTIASMGRVSTDPSRIKQHVVDRGPLAVCLGVGDGVGGAFDGSNVYRCTDDVTTNHCVVLTGYNDNDAGGYWIAKNSWGDTWGPDEDGYFKVGYGECSIENWVYYASLVDQTCTSYTSTDVPKAIPDLSTVTSNINVGDSFTLSDVHVGPLNITHTYDDDLDVYLISPASTRVELFTDIGGSGNNFVGTAFDDESFYPIALNDNAGYAPFTWTFSPEGVLADLNGESSSGQWRLEVTDDEGGDTGTLNSWELELCGEAPTPNCGPGVDTDGDGFDDDAECYLVTDPLDACRDDPTDDAWPLDMNMDKSVTMADVFKYSGKIGRPVSGDPLLRRLDLNMDNSITMADVFKYSGKIGQTCT